SNDVVGMVRTTGKLPLYLACGKYVTATDVGEARRVLPGVGCLLPYKGVRDDDHPEPLAQHLQKLTDHSNRLCVQAAARHAAKDHFDYCELALRVQRICIGNEGNGITC